MIVQKSAVWGSGGVKWLPKCMVLVLVGGGFDGRSSFSGRSVQGGKEEHVGEGTFH